LLMMTRSARGSWRVQPARATISNGRIAPNKQRRIFPFASEREFVASFIGACNFLHGAVTGQVADKLHVQLGAGGRAVMPSSRDGRKDVLISVRPEAVALNALEASATTSDSGTPATVQQVVYRGQATHVHMALDDGTPFLAFLPNPQAMPASSTLSIGDRVWASWPPESNWAVADA